MKWLVPLVLTPLLVGCLATAGPQLKTRWVAPGYPDTEDNPPLRDGQIVLSVTPDAMAMVYILGSDIFSPYVHAGVIAIEDGEPFVYEALGWGLPWPGERPTDAIEGQILRTSFLTFLGRQRTLAIFDPPDPINREKVVAFARKAVEEKVPFDPHFDAVDHSKLYCTEFVGLALEAGGHRPLATYSGRKNRSLKVGLDWLRLKTHRTLPASALIGDATPVAVLSLDQNNQEIMIWHAIRRVLYVRFTEDQRLGHLFRWRGLSLDYRPEIQDFIDHAVGQKGKLTDIQDQQVMDELISMLAVEYFGPVVRNCTDPCLGVGRM